MAFAIGTAKPDEKKKASARSMAGSPAGAMSTAPTSRIEVAPPNKLSDWIGPSPCVGEVPDSVQNPRFAIRNPLKRSEISRCSRGLAAAPPVFAELLLGRVMSLAKSELSRTAARSKVNDWQALESLNRVTRPSSWGS
uniref:Uncharacterized protein n=1 Tax=Bionectria ochroleuca TaxID=29856 RepID=A0A8H7NN62_BIOOC